MAPEFGLTVRVFKRFYTLLADFNRGETHPISDFNLSEV